MRRPPHRRRVAVLCGLVGLAGASVMGCGSGSETTRGTEPATSRPSPTAEASAPRRTPSTTNALPTTRTEPAHPAPSVTSVQLTLVDESRPTVSNGATVAPTRTLPAVVWLPADASGHVRGSGLPWVVFLHGYLAEPQRYSAMLQTWARAGYAVVAPTFPLTSSSSGAIADEADMVNEPADVTFLISEMLQRSAAATGPLAGLLDPDRIGLAGHSDGANVAFATGYSASLGDRRIQAVIDLSGELPTGMGPYPGSGPPLLLIHADQDEFVPHSQTAALYGEVAVARWWVELHGVGHEPPFVGHNAWSAVVDTVTVAFLDRTLGGHPVSAATIAEAANQPPTATLEASAGSRR